MYYMYYWYMYVYQCVVPSPERQEKMTQHRDKIYTVHIHTLIRTIPTLNHYTRVPNTRVALLNKNRNVLLILHKAFLTRISSIASF